MLRGHAAYPADALPHIFLLFTDSLAVAECSLCGRSRCHLRRDGCQSYAAIHRRWRPESCRSWRDTVSAHNQVRHILGLWPCLWLGVSL